MPFLLTHEPWIPCVTPAGARVELGLLEAFARAHELAAIHDASPLVTLALYRLALAVLHRVFGPPDLATWRALHARGAFDAAALGAYFDRWRARFDLVHPERPFYQTRGLRELYEPDGLGRLVLERSNYGHEVDVFQHRSGPALEADALPFGDAARALLALHAFAPCGTVRKSGEPTSASAAPLNGAACVLVRGRSLFETLMFNLLEYGADRPIPSVPGADVPAWEQDALRRPGPSEPSRLPFGWIDLLTWQSRRVELEIDNGTARGIVYCVGQKLDLTGLTPEPMFAYRRTKKDVLAFRLSSDRALWRDSHALVQFADVESGTRPPRAVEQLRRFELIDVLGDAPLVLDVLGMKRGKELAQIKLTRHERVAVPLSVVNDPDRQAALRDAMQLAEDVALRVVFAVRGAVEEALAPGERRADPDEVRRFTESLAPERPYWTTLGSAFETLLDDLARDEADAAVRFEREIRSAAEESLRRAAAALGTSARQLQGAARAERQIRAALAELMPHREGGGAP